MNGDIVGGLIVGAIAGVVLTLALRPYFNPLAGTAQFYRHKGTGQGYWFQGRAELRDDYRTEIVLLSPFGNLPSGERPTSREWQVWTARELMDEFESYTPDEFKKQPNVPPPQTPPAEEEAHAARKAIMNQFDALTRPKGDV